VKQNNHGVTKMDMYLSDYIERTTKKLNEERAPLKEPEQNPNDYRVYPEDDGTDAKRNPYSPV
jgi:hypothetical protein